MKANLGSHAADAELLISQSCQFRGGRFALGTSMPSSKANRFSEFPYQVTNRCINKDWFAMPMDQVWSLMADYLYLTQKCFNIQIHSFVLMSNHYHLLVTCPDKNLSEAIGFFQRHTSVLLTKNAGRINHTWAQRFKRTEICSYHHFMNTYKYIYQNPVRAGICNRVEKYSYSTLPGLLGLSQIPVPLVEDTILFNGDLQKNLDWLNQVPSSDNNEAMRLALRKSQFRLPKINAREHPLEFDAL